MDLPNKKKMYILMWIISAVIVLLAVVAILFINQSSFGRLPQGERLERIKRSPNYRNGEFHNQSETLLFTSDKGRFRSMLEFMFRESEGLRPDSALPVIKTDLRKIDRSKEVLVWFGHSSYFIQTAGKRLLIDPVFRQASPVSFINKPFKGTDVYTPVDMPDIDYLIISHDHWDHLDYQTVMELKDRIGKVICPLGVGEHFEYWGFGKEQMIELDWNEHISLEHEFTVHCLPARHFSGRGLTSNQSLWASFLVQTPTQQIYIGGDGSYDKHFGEIGKQFPQIDLAMIENGQYNEDWKYIHLMPQHLAQAMKDLGAKKIVTVHHSKYALAKHRWDEPLINAREAAKDDSLNVLLPTIGQIVDISPNPATKIN